MAGWHQNNVLFQMTQMGFAIRFFHQRVKQRILLNWIKIPKRIPIFIEINSQMGKPNQIRRRTHKNENL